MRNDLEILFGNCSSALDAGNATLANSFLEQAYPLLLNYPNRHIMWGFYYLNLSSVYNNMGKFKESRDCCYIADRFIISRGNEVLKAQIQSNLGNSFLNTGDFLKSTYHSQNALRLFKKLNKQESVALELITIGEISLRNELWSKSIKNYSEALYISKKIHNKRLEARTLMALGFVFRGHRFLYLAIDHYRAAERLFKEINFYQGIVSALFERANTYLSLRMPEMTTLLMKQIETMIPYDSTMRKFVLKLQYCIHNQNKEFSQAIECANILLDFFKNAQDKRGEAECFEMIGSCHYNLSQMDQAQFFGEKANKIAVEIGDKILQSICMELFQDIKSLSANDIDAL